VEHERLMQMYDHVASGKLPSAVYDLILHIGLLDARINDLRQQYALLQQDVSEMKAREMVAER